MISFIFHEVILCINKLNFESSDIKKGRHFHAINFAVINYENVVILTSIKVIHVLKQLRSLSITYSMSVQQSLEHIILLELCLINVVMQFNPL